MVKPTHKESQTKVKLSRVSSAPEGYTIAPPDGGWGWAVLIGCFIAGLNTVVSMSTFAVILNDLTSVFSTSTSTLSWIPSVSVSTGQFLGPVSTVVINKCGCRKAAIFGGLLMFSGITLSYFVTRVEYLILTYGVITGLGSGLCHTTYPVILSHYFKKYYGLAIGCLVASFATSRLILTPLAQLILEEYGCRATMLIMGSLTLHICIGGCLFQPVKWHTILVKVEEETAKKPLVNELANDKNGSNANDKTPIKEQVKLLNTKKIRSTEDMTHESLKFATSLESMNMVYSEDLLKTPDGGSEEKSCMTSCFSKGLCKSIDLSLFSEPLFYIVCLNGAGVLAVMVFGNLFLFPLGIEIGLAPMEAATVMSGKAVADIFGRLVGPFLISLLKLPTRYTFMALNFINAIGLAAFLIADTFEVFVSLAIITGVIFGAVIGLNGVLMVKCMGVKRLSSVIGLSAFLQGFLMLPMAPIMGWIRDATGSFKNVFLFLSILQVLVVILWCLKPLVTRSPGK